MRKYWEAFSSLETTDKVIILGVVAIAIAMLSVAMYYNQHANWN